MTRHTRAPVLIGSSAFLVGLIAVAVQLLDGQPSTERFVYVFDCAGQYIRIALSTGEHTMPRGVPGVPSGVDGFDGCLLKALAVDPDSSVVYAVMPTQRFVDSLGQRHDKLVALRLPALRTVSSVNTPEATDRPPELHLDNLTHRLTLGYRTSEESPGSLRNQQYVISTAHPEHLELEEISGSTTVRGRETLAPVLSGRAYKDISGRIVDGNRVIATNGAISSLTGYELMTDQLRQSFQNLQRTGATGNKYLDIVFADSAAGRMLFIVAWDTLNDQSPARGGIVVYDAIKNKVVSSFITPYREAALELTTGTPTVHLSPDGERVVVEEYQWHQSDGASNQERFKTGKIAVYDAASGNQIGIIQLDRASGNSGRIVGFSTDSTLLYYFAAGDFYIVDLGTSQTRTISMPQDFSPAAVVTAVR